MRAEPTWIWERDAWPRFRWDALALAEPLARARHAQGRVAGITSLLDPDQDLAAQLELFTREGLATSAIEGERLDPGSLRSSLARRLGVSAGGLTGPTRVTDALADLLLDATRKCAEPLTLERLCDWQAALFPSGRSGVQRIRVGALRGPSPMRIVSGPIGRERVHFEAPPSSRLRSELGALLRWIERPPEPTDGLLRAGIAHVWFEVLHPFEDGNGRVGRALVDLLLARDEGRPVRSYSLSGRLMAERKEYYAQLDAVSRGDLEITPWLLWFVGRVEAAAHESETVLREVLRRARFFGRHGGALNERQRKAMQRMLDAGPSGFEGGMTNRKYASLTRTSPATAQRDLAQLVELGCLTLVGAGRTARYELAADALTA